MSPDTACVGTFPLFLLCGDGLSGAHRSVLTDTVADTSEFLLDTESCSGDLPYSSSNFIQDLMLGETLGSTVDSFCHHSVLQARERG